MYDIAARYITNADVRKLREDNNIPISATELNVGTLGAARNRSRKYSLSREGSRVHSLTELNIPKSFDNNAINIVNKDLLRSQKSRTPNDIYIT